MAGTFQNVDPHTVAQAIAAEFAELDQVEAVVLGGSVGAGRGDSLSDIDLYIFCRDAVPVAARAQIIEHRASRMELDNPFWETEDYWIEKDSRIKVEAIYRGEWVAENLREMFVTNRAQLSHSTSIWHSVKTSQVLYDRNGWFASLRNLAAVPYPDALADAIIRKNFAVLRGSLAAHPAQLAQAVIRNDAFCIHQLIHVILDSYFDILFALNRQLHPGAKRLLAYAEELEHQPKEMREDVTDILSDGNSVQITSKVDRLIDRLAALLEKHRALF